MLRILPEPLDAVAYGHVGPLIVWLLLPAACVAAVLVQFVVVGPLMLLTALVFGRRRGVACADREDRLEG